MPPARPHQSAAPISDGGQDPEPPSQSNVAIHTTSAHRATYTYPRRQTRLCDIRIVCLLTSTAWFCCTATEPHLQPCCARRTSAPPSPFLLCCRLLRPTPGETSLLSALSRHAPSMRKHTPARLLTSCHHHARHDTMPPARPHRSAASTPRRRAAQPEPRHHTHTQIVRVHAQTPTPRHTRDTANQAPVSASMSPTQRACPALPPSQRALSADIRQRGHAREPRSRASE